MSLTICLITACTAVDRADPQPEAYDDDKADAAGSIFQRVKLVDMSFSEESVIDDPAAAAAEADKFLADTEAFELDSCAAEFQVAREHVFGRFDGCRTFAQPVTFPDHTRYAPAFECDAGYCALHSLDGADVVRFDGSSPSATLARAANPIVVVDLPKLAALASTEDITMQPVTDAHGVLAVVPHVFVRTDSGGFVQAPQPPALAHNAGAQVSLGFAPAALRVVLPSDADRLELYFKFERWNYTRIEGEDASVAARLDSRASDQFVSNFGKNYVVPVR